MGISSQFISKRGVLAQAIALSLSGSVFAQVTQELELTTVESESIERDAVVDVIDVNEINQRQVDDFEDLVRMIPGVTVSKSDDRWGSSGFNIRGLDEDRVAINVDGVPQGETLKYEGGQAYGYFKGSRNGVDIEALKRVEIVKGADAILSGSGSLSGAVNMTTKDPEDYLSVDGNDLGFGFKTGYSGINDESMISFAAANRIGNLESLLIYTRREGHEYESYDMDAADIEGSEREVPDPQDRETNSLLVKLIYNATPDQSFGLVGSYYDRNTLTDTRSYNGGFYSNRMGDDTSETKRVGVFHEYAGENAFFDGITTALNFQEVNFEANTAQHAFFDFGPFFRADEDRVDTRIFDQELMQFTIDLNKSVSLGETEHNLVYGAEVLQKEFENSQNRRANSAYNTLGWVDANIGALIPASESDIVNFYILDTFSLGENTQIRLGLRNDGYEYNASADENYADDTATLGKIDFSTTTWTVGIEQSLTNSLTLEAGVSTGFRAPTIEDMYSTSGSVDDWGTVANPDLEAEYSTNFDVALVGQLNAAEYRVGVFYSEYDDFIDYQLRNGINTNTGLADPNGYQVPVNSNEVEMKGVELSSTIDLAEAFSMPLGLTTNFQAAYTDGENANGDPVYSVQPFNVTWRVSFDDPAGLWGLSMMTSHTSGKENDDSYSTDDLGVRTYPLYLSNTATIVDLMGYYDISDNLRLRAGINNLTDKEYYTWDSVRFVDQGDRRPGIGVTGNGIMRYSEPGRSYELSVNYQF